MQRAFEFPPTQLTGNQAAGVTVNATAAAAVQSAITFYRMQRERTCLVTMEMGNQQHIWMLPVTDTAAMANINTTVWPRCQLQGAC
jgi:hypothetical protein